MEWNERTNVCGKATELQTMGGVLPQIIPTEDTTGQPLTRAICEAAKMQWNESSNVCGAGSMPFAAQQSAVPPSIGFIWVLLDRQTNPRKRAEEIRALRQPAETVPAIIK
jgi:hypothetical protein